MTENWTESRHGRIALLSFARPPKNWMNVASMTELVTHLERLAEQSDEITVIVLTGGVDEYFIAHADLDDLAKIARGEEIEGNLRSWVDALALLESMPQPTVAAIDGQAWGGGCELALACTLRIGSERAHLSQPEVKLGIIPGAGGTQRLPRLVGGGIGAELCLSGRVVHAEEAKQIGLLNAVLPTEQFIEAALGWCEPIADNPAAAVFAAKEAVVQGLRLPLSDGLRLEGRLFAKANSSDEAQKMNASWERPS